MKRILFITHSSSAVGGAEDDFERLLKHFSNKKDNYIIEGLFPPGERGKVYSKFCDRYGYYRSGTFPEIFVGVLIIFKYFIKCFIQLHDLYRFTKKLK